MFILVSGLVLVIGGSFVVVHASTEVIGIIGSDTTWTKANSPYDLAGNVLVNNGVKLTIEAGVTVNLHDFYIMVNGTLHVQGTETERVQFNGGKIMFTEYSYGWNEQESSGCVINSANLNTTMISSDVSLKVTNVYSNSIFSVDGSAIISHCFFKWSVTVGDSSVISHSTLSGQTSVGNSSAVTDSNITYSIHMGNQATITNNNIKGRIYSGSASMVNNTIKGTISVITQNSATSEIRNNTIRGGGAALEFDYFTGTPKYAIYPRTAIELAGGTAVISNNTIISYDLTSEEFGEIGSDFDGGYGITTQLDCVAEIKGNVISGGFVSGINVMGPATIQGNLILNNSGGIAIGKIEDDHGLIISEWDVTICDNILANSEIGIGGHISNYYYDEADHSATGKERTVTIERNLIVDSQKGIDVDLRDASLNIQNNTIANCSVAIALTLCPSAAINLNNIQNYTQGITLADTSVNIDAASNWWGTTDSDEISQKIYDYYEDFYLGTVNFTPFLTEPNDEATPNLEIPEFNSWICLPLFLAATFVAITARKRITKRTK